MDGGHSNVNTRRGNAWHSTRPGRPRTTRPIGPSAFRFEEARGWPDSATRACAPARPRTAPTASVEERACSLKGRERERRRGARETGSEREGRAHLRRPATPDRIRPATSRERMRHFDAKGKSGSAEGTTTRNGEERHSVGGETEGPGARGRRPVSSSKRRTGGTKKGAREERPKNKRRRYGYTGERATCLRGEKRVSICVAPRLREDGAPRRARGAASFPRLAHVTLLGLRGVHLGTDDLSALLKVGTLRLALAEDKDDRLPVIESEGSARPP